MEPTDWDAVVRPHVEGRRVILAGGPVAQWTGDVATLRRLGAGPILVMGTGSVGTGSLPDPADAEWFTVEVPDRPTLIERIRETLTVLAAPPVAAVARLDAFDPDRGALVLGDFLNTAPRLGERPFLAHRRAAWVALEDKVAVDAFWDRAGVTRVAAEVVAADERSVAEATRRVDLGDGVVLAGDAREGWHGGASLVRWATSAALLEAGVAVLAEHCDRVRVMPFLPGIPCSVHGIVLPDGTAVLRPVEMVVARRPDGRFFYAGCATFHDPPVAVRDEMRAVAARVGARLRAEVGFRGAFTIDGVVTAEGFRPTELNPRNGAGLSLMARGSGIPVQLLLDLAVAGVPVACSAPGLEQALLAHADAHRTGGTWSGVHGVAAEAATLEWDLDGAPVHVTVGPAHGGCFVRAVFDPEHTPVGPPVGTRAVEVWRRLDERFGFGIGALVAAEEAGPRRG